MAVMAVPKADLACLQVVLAAEKADLAWYLAVWAEHLAGWAFGTAAMALWKVGRAAESVVRVWLLAAREVPLAFQHCNARFWEASNGAACK